MDLQSLWLTNCHLLDGMSDSEYKRKENALYSCLGGTKNIIKLILQNPDNLSFVQHKQLFQELKKPLAMNKENDPDTAHMTDTNHTISPNKENDKNTPRILSHLNENCLSHIFQFLNGEDGNSFSFTSRAICIASKSKSSHLNHEVRSFPLHRVYHFMHQLSEIKTPYEGSKACTEQFERLTSWIHQQSITHQYQICHIICKSGLLPSFSQWLTEEQLTVEDTALIQHIVNLFGLLSRFTLHKYLINVDLIENLQILMETMLAWAPEIDYTDIRTILNKSDIVPDIVRILSHLFHSDIPLRSSVLDRVFISDIIATLIHIVRAPNALNCTKDIMWITRVNDLIANWLYHWNWKGSCITQDDRSTVQMISDHIIPHYIEKMNAIIDVRSEKGWIYHLICEGRVIRIRHPDVPPPPDTYDFATLFKVSEVVEISPPNDTTPSITLIGQFLTGDGPMPDQKISVPLSHIQMVQRRVPKGIYHEIMHFVLSLCRLIAAEQRCYAFHDLQSTHYQQINALDSLKRAIHVSQRQVLDYSLNDILCTLLSTDWILFMELLAEQVKTEFEKLPLKDLYGLMTIAWNTGNLQSLCKLEWFKRRLFEGINSNAFLNSLMFNSHPFPSDWTQEMLIALVKEFYSDRESYEFLKYIIDRAIPNNVNDSIDANGIHYLLMMVVNSYLHSTTDWCVKWIQRLTAMFVKRFSVTAISTCNLLKSTMQSELKEIEESKIIKDWVLAIWWIILLHVLMEDQTDELRVKCVVNEMQWFLATYRYPDTDLVSYSAIGTAAQCLQTLIQTQNFQDEEIVASLRSLLSLLPT